MSLPERIRKNIPSHKTSPIQSGVKGIVKREHQEGDTRVMDELEIESVSVPQQPETD